MDKPNNNPTPAPAPETTPQDGGEKTFTQTEVDTIVSRRVARAMKGMPEEAELNDFRAWKENQKTEKDKLDTLASERDAAKTDLAAAQAELEQLRREKFLRDKGVPVEDVDYYAFKIGKLVTEDKAFDEAAEEFLKENTPRGAGDNSAANKSREVRVDITAGLNGGKTDAEPSSLAEALKQKYDKKG